MSERSKHSFKNITEVKFYKSKNNNNCIKITGTTPKGERIFWIGTYVPRAMALQNAFIEGLAHFGFTGNIKTLYDKSPAERLCVMRRPLCYV